MSMVLCISRGRYATIEAPMLIFSNENSSYSIWILLDDIFKMFYNNFWLSGHIKLIFINA